LAAEHATHVPTQVVSQHTPSMQKPVMHSSPAVHDVPLPCFATHIEPLQ
jgi:hypothetical protein